MPSRAVKQEDGNSDGGKGTAGKEGDGKKMEVFQNWYIPLIYTREVRSMMASIFSRKDHHVTIREEAVHFR